MKSPGRHVSVVAPLVCAVVLSGCWNRNNGSNENPLGDGGVPDLGDRICNAVQAGNTFIQPADSGNATAPAPTGGALTDGSYHLTSSAYYPAASCAFDPISANMVVTSSSPTSGTMQTASLTSVGYFVSESTAYEINDTSLTTRIDCIAPDAFGLLGNAAQISYSATPTEIQIYGSGGCGNRIDIYDLD